MFLALCKPYQQQQQKKSPKKGIIEKLVFNCILISDTSCISSIINLTHVGNLSLFTHTKTTYENLLYWNRSHSNGHITCLLYFFLFSSPINLYCDYWREFCNKIYNLYKKYVTQMWPEMKIGNDKRRHWKSHLIVKGVNQDI